MVMPGRKYPTDGGLYRYGFNGKENDNEVKGEGNQQDYGMRIYDPRLVKFLSVDPLTKRFSMLTPYQFASNTPIQAIDLDGGEAKIVTTTIFSNSSGETVINTLKTEQVNNPYRLGPGTLYQTRIHGLIGVKDNTIYTYEPIAPEKKSILDKIREIFGKAFEDQGYPDDGGPGGTRSHQMYGIIFTSNNENFGTTTTGTGNDATFYDVVDNAGALFGLVKGTGGSLNIESNVVNKIITTMTKVAEEAKGAAEVVSEAATMTSNTNTKPPTVEQKKTVAGKWQYSNKDGGITDGGTTSTEIKKSNNDKTPDTLIKTYHTETPNPSKKGN
jgi:RHS repeat-associated protein